VVVLLECRRQLECCRQAALAAMVVANACVWMDRLQVSVLLLVSVVPVVLLVVASVCVWQVLVAPAVEPPHCLKDKFSSQVFQQTHPKPI